MANKLIQLQDAAQNKLFPKVILKSIYANTTATTPFDFDSLATDAELKVVSDALATLQGEVSALASAAVTRQVVTALPTEGQKENVIYMILKTDDSDPVANTGSVYNEYMWINGGWQLIGDTALDLSGYVTDGELDTYKGEVTEALALKADSSVVEGINGRLGTAEGEIDVLQAATAGFNGDNTIADALALKGDKSVVDGLVSATAGYTGEGAIKTAVDAKADAANAALTTGTIATVAEGDTAIVNRGTVAGMIEAVTGSAVYYEDLGEIVEA